MCFERTNMGAYYTENFTADYEFCPINGVGKAFERAYDIRLEFASDAEVKSVHMK